MRSLGMLKSESDCASNFELCSSLLKGIDLEATLPMKKVITSQYDCLLVMSILCSLFFYFIMFYNLHVHSFS